MFDLFAALFAIEILNVIDLITTNVALKKGCGELNMIVKKYPIIAYIFKFVVLEASIVLLYCISSQWWVVLSIFFSLFTLIVVINNAIIGGKQSVS